MAFQDYTESARARLHLGQVRPQVVIGIAVLGLALIGALIYGAHALAGPQDALLVEADAAEPAGQEADGGSEAAAPATVIVHVGGCVASPGVYQLQQGARVSDAVESAGGLTAEAAADSINLARAVEDGEQVIVPSAEAAAAEAAGAQPAAGQAPSSSSSALGKVNINTADATELQTLSGVGESKAEKIIAYREENGPFKSVDDLTNVSGIGEKTLDALRDSICV